MLQDYKAFIDRMISRYEGGYGWERSDPGGPTRFGITCYDLAAHRGQRMTSMAAWAPLCKAMPLSEAEDIYRSKYAVAVHFDELPVGIDCCWLDYAVNSGIGRPIKVAQAFLGVAVDGVFGPKTMAAVRSYGESKFVGHMCDERMRFLRALRIWPVYKGGWTARVNDLRAYCGRLISHVPPIPSDAVAMKPDLNIGKEEMAKSYVSTFWSRMDHRAGNTETPFISTPIATAGPDDAREYTKGGPT
jgi:lysozyme family protein